MQNLDHSIIVKKSYFGTVSTKDNSLVGTDSIHSCSSSGSSFMIVFRVSAFFTFHFFLGMSSFGPANTDPLLGLCFLHFFFGKTMIQDGTSQPDDAITLAIFRKNGISSSV